MNEHEKIKAVINRLNTYHQQTAEHEVPYGGGSFDLNHPEFHEENKRDCLAYIAKGIAILLSDKIK